MNKDLKALKRVAERQGWIVTQTNGKHYEWRNPEGVLVTRTAGTCSGKRTVKNYVAYLKRGGLQLGKGKK